MAGLTADLDYPMVIVTATAAGERSGCLVGFHTQCSIDPFQWAVLVSKANHTHSVTRAADVLAVHFPSEDDLDLARLFGEQTGDETDKFAQCAWTAGVGDVPLLDRIGNRVVGRVVDRFDAGGDHQFVVIDVIESSHDAPLRQLDFQQVRGFHPGHPS
jgi:flavin reductase (DIM6/NTAB) family NADH-FMN oxidoreductase RutF